MKAKPDIKTMRVSDLKPAPWNPRSISEAALKGLNRSIERFGLVEPIIWNKRTGHVVGGHQRLKVLEAEHVEETLVVVVDLPEIEEKALNVALNNPRIQGEFTVDLEPLLAEIKSSDIADLFDELRLDTLVKTQAGKAMAELPPMTPEYQVVIDCPNEAEQERIYNALTEQGFKCRPLTL